MGLHVALMVNKVYHCWQCKGQETMPDQIKSDQAGNGRQRWDVEFLKAMGNDRLKE